MDKKQREARRHQEDIALTRALLWIAAAVVLEGLLVLVNRFYINYYLDEIEIVVVLQSVLKVIRIAGLVVAAVCLVLAAFRAKMGQKAILPLLIAWFDQILLLLDFSLRLAPSARSCQWHFVRGCRDFTDPLYLHHSE